MAEKPGLRSVTPQYPDHILDIKTPPGFGRIAGERVRQSAWPTVLRLLFAVGAARERAILELTSARATDLSDVLTDWIAWAQECPVSRRNGLSQLLATARFAAVEKPAVPLLILAGAGDRMVHPRCSQRLVP